MAAKINRTGKTYGDLTVLETIPGSNSKADTYLVKCNCCGNTMIIGIDALLKGLKCKDCRGKDRKRTYQDLVGEEHNGIKVISLAEDAIGSTGHRNIRYNCMCSCGKEFVAYRSSLLRGKVKSCGCCKHITEASKMLVDNAEAKIYEAATDLLGSKHRFPVPATSQSLYSKNQIIWSDDIPTKLEDAVIDLCCCRSDKAKTISQANESGSETTIRILEKTKLYQGRITVLSDIEKNLVVNVWNLDMNNKGCSASSFTQMTLDELLGNFAKHYTDMEIDRSQTCRDADGTSRDFARAINIYNSLFAKSSDGSTSSFNNALWKQLSISIYSGTKYPEQVLSLALLRSCRLLQQNKKGKENRITASLAGITKAFLIRNYGENMTMGLNSNNTSPAYITGRIFAHMESAQRKIDPNNQTTYAKRFFERVMMNPAKTMPELHKSFLLLKNKAKANGMRGLYNSSDKKIMALIDMLDGNYPDHLSEKQKGEYLVGYYQQRSANIKDAEEKKNRKAAKIETNNTDTATTVATQKEK